MNAPDPWAMTDADIAVYDAAFAKQDKDGDGFISPKGRLTARTVVRTWLIILRHVTPWISLNIPGQHDLGIVHIVRMCAVSASELYFEAF